MEEDAAWCLPPGRVTQTDWRQNVGNKVDSKDLYYSDRQGDWKQCLGNKRENLRNVTGEDLGNELVDVVINCLALFDRFNNSCAVMVKLNDVRSFFGTIGSALAHGVSISARLSAEVINPVNGNSDHVIYFLRALTIDSFCLGQCVQTPSHHRAAMQLLWGVINKESINCSTL